MLALLKFGISFSGWFGLVALAYWFCSWLVKFPAICVVLVTCFNSVGMFGFYSCYCCGVACCLLRVPLRFAFGGLLFSCVYLGFVLCGLAWWFAGCVCVFDCGRLVVSCFGVLGLVRMCFVCGLGLVV